MAGPCRNPVLVPNRPGHRRGGASRALLARRPLRHTQVAALPIQACAHRAPQRTKQPCRFASQLQARVLQADVLHEAPLVRSGRPTPRAAEPAGTVCDPPQPCVIRRRWRGRHRWRLMCLSCGHRVCRIRPDVSPPRSGDQCTSSDESCQSGPGRQRVRCTCRFHVSRRCEAPRPRRGSPIRRLHVAFRPASRRACIIHVGVKHELLRGRGIQLRVRRVQLGRRRPLSQALCSLLPAGLRRGGHPARCRSRAAGAALPPRSGMTGFADADPPRWPARPHRVPRGRSA